MTIKKKTLSENTASIEDDYYALQRQKIAEEAQKAHRIHEEDIHLHLVANIPYYEDADPIVRRALVKLNNLLLHRFDQPGLIIWQFLKHEPTEIKDYAADFGDDLSESDQKLLIHFLQDKKQEEDNMVDMGFDEDGEEDEYIKNRDDQDHDLGQHDDNGDNDENEID